MKNSSYCPLVATVGATLVMLVLMDRIDPVVGGGCAEGEGLLSCYGAKMVRNAFRRLASEKSLQLMPGVEIVAEDEKLSEAEEEAERAYNEIGGDEDYHENDGVFGRIGRYLASHELKINLGQMIRRSELREVVGSTLRTVHEELGGLEGMEEARKKDKSGMGAILMMGVMMSKVLGALGFGGVAMLAMKALGVSMMALLLSAILGLKKLTEGGGGDHKGRMQPAEEVAADEIQVFSDGHVAGSGGVEGQRKRRSPELAYRGWAERMQ